MKVIFLEDVARVGKRHDIKDVPDGYAINFLFPRRIAEAATKSKISELENRKKKIIIEREVEENLLSKNLEDLKGKTITIKGKANEKGSLFSAIHKKEIIAAMKDAHQTEIGEEFIILEKPIKDVGEYEIPIKMKGKSSSLRLIVERA